MEKASSFIGKIVEVEMDRPLGTRHPKHNFMYPVNYGYVPGTVSGDGEELDAYVLGVFEPLNNYIGKCIAVIHRINDDDDKLVVVPEGKNYTDEEISRALIANAPKNIDIGDGTSIAILYMQPWKEIRLIRVSNTTKTMIK